MFRRFALFIGCCGLVACVVTGCGDDKDAVYPVSGKITLDGNPLPKDVGVSFEPVKSSGEVASALVNEDGTYQLFTGIAGRVGAAAGSYKVVLKYNKGAGEDRYNSKPGAQSSAPVEEKGPFPEAWGKAATTPKTVEVKSGKNEINIDITK